MKNKDRIRMVRFNTELKQSLIVLGMDQSHWQMTCRVFENVPEHVPEQAPPNFSKLAMGLDRL